MSKVFAFPVGQSAGRSQYTLSTREAAGGRGGAELRLRGVLKIRRVLITGRANANQARVHLKKVAGLKDFACFS